MRENDGRKLDHKTLEALLLRAVERINSGAHPEDEDVAAALGLHRETVYGWLAKYRDRGRGALLARPVPGRPSRHFSPCPHRLRLWLSAYPYPLRCRDRYGKRAEPSGLEGNH